jgi:hypothetical protein
MSLAQPNIFIAFGLSNGNHLFIKLLRMPQTMVSSGEWSANETICHVVG